MSVIKKNKLNTLIGNWPRGMIYTQSYLTKLGITRDNVKKYRRNKWISNVGRGAYRLSNDVIDIYGAINALQTQLKTPIHLGGKSIIELKGYAQYPKFGKPQFYVYAPTGTIIPKWFLDYNWGGRLKIIKTRFLPEMTEFSFTTYQKENLPIKISSLERAVLELLYHIPGDQGFEETELILEGLQNLRVQALQELFEACKSIKVVRLGLYFADSLNLPWFSKLDVNKVNMGKGKRVIQSGGILDKKYLITVPKDTSI